MARNYRPVIGVNIRTGAVQMWDSAYRCALELGVAVPSVSQAQNRNGDCVGWRMYDTPEYYEKQIAVLRERMKEVNELMK